uniref:Guanylate cyclase domain-containing protein n=2 Tax=Pseudo-nitzschia australis TaxID=44445 RepID=A0A7S4ACL1_9STRA
MAEVTGRSVAIFLLVNLLVVLLCTYTELDTTAPSTMVILHGQTTTQKTAFARKALDTARRSTIPNLYYYSATSNINDINFTWASGEEPENRPINTKNITVIDERGGKSIGLFDIEAEVNQRVMMELILLLCVLLTWFVVVSAFAGPVITLVIYPIERAVKLLSMLVMDPLGYQNTLQYKKFLTQSDQIAKDGWWSREVLKGMETEFLMSTIVRIGSLMKVGFGSAGVQIIRNNLQKSHNNETGTLILNSRGSMVSCIFMFCDIRSFTDATECLQEEVFVFTNQVAAVVHSICNSYAGSANKNIGDAFLVSWKLDESLSGTRTSFNGVATRHQADKALLSAVKISIALHHDDFYVGLLSNHAKSALLNKFKDRHGPIVQLGFGLHAGMAIEGAIGSQRKIDATYVSMAVETAEYLETSTKKYKLNMLMSCSFHRLLHPSRRKRCRKIDRLMFGNEDDDFYEKDVSNEGKMKEIFTYDIDVDALFDDTESDDDEFNDCQSESDNSSEIAGPRDQSRSGFIRLSKRRRSVILKGSSRETHDTKSGSIRGDNQHLTAAIAAAAAKAMRSSPATNAETTQERETQKKTRELTLPTGPALYSENIWLQKDIKRLRRQYTTFFFDTYNLGLKKYYSKEWDDAKMLFEANLKGFEDGPSRYFLNEMNKYDGIPPADFQHFGKA